eukprot:scaffold101225_cov31-Tisochrysis_lutea.AAC.2
MKATDLRALTAPSQTCEKGYPEPRASQRPGHSLGACGVTASRASGAVGPAARRGTTEPTRGDN